MKTFGWMLLAAIGGYVMGLIGGIMAIETFSPNTHDKSLEAAMTGAFVVGPVMAIIAVTVVLITHYRRAR